MVQLTDSFLCTFLVFIAVLVNMASVSAYTNVNGPGCRCNPVTSNNDVMLLFDTSSGMSENLNRALATAFIALDDFTVGLASDGNVNSTTRVGVITYASNATLVTPLGTFDDLYSLFNITASSTDSRTNLNDSLSLAMSELSGKNHRNTSRPVILIFTAVYNDDSDITPLVTRIREMGAIVIVWDFVSQTPDPLLVGLASPGYFIDAETSRDGDIQQALCDGNCYCASTLTAFAPDDNPRHLPTAGCYFASKAQSNYKFASVNCQNYGDNIHGLLATDRTSEKTEFLIQNMKVPGVTMPQQIIGLNYDTIQAEYLWSDGQPLDCSNYCPWCNGVQPNPITDGTAVFLFPNSGSSTTGCWAAQQTNKGAAYTCEFEPCDSANFCDQAGF